MTPAHSSTPTVEVSTTITNTGERRIRRARPAMGPRCPQCAGPLVFGEGCSLCPICGFSGCAT